MCVNYCLQVFIDLLIKKLNYQKNGKKERKNKSKNLFNRKKTACPQSYALVNIKKVN